jgi:hypothetical protein
MLNNLASNPGRIGSIITYNTGLKNIFDSIRSVGSVRVINLSGSYLHLLEEVFYTYEDNRIFCEDYTGYTDH